MNFFTNLLNRFCHGKENTSQTTRKTAINKTQIIVFWVVLKILVDKIMIILPEPYEANGYYVAQSAWLLILFILLFYSMKKFYQLMAMVGLIIYQLVDLLTEVYILFGGLTISSGMPLIWGASGVSLLIVSIILLSKYDH